MIVVKPTGGLCNKLRVIFSYWEHCKITNKKLTVIWKVDEECPGFFLDYFEPVEGITFLIENSEDLKIDYEGYDCHENFNAGKKFIFFDLKLQNKLQDKVNEKVQLLGDFIAIQVRRTDHTDFAKRSSNFTTDEEFCNFIDKNPDGNLFITADNKKSYNFFRTKYPDRVKIDYPKDDPTKLRHILLEDSIIDLYISIYSKKIKISRTSSFGETISQLRRQLI